MAICTRSFPLCMALIGALLTITGLAAENLPPQPPLQNQCVTCHCDVKGLIRLCWKVEKLKPKAARSAETSGEG